MLPALFLAAAVAAPPVQWEYMILEAYGINAGPAQEFLGIKSEPTARSLNKLGAEGWELVTVTRASTGERVYMFLKREIPRATPSASSGT
jgi:hypothetical protein